MLTCLITLFIIKCFGAMDTPEAPWVIPLHLSPVALFKFPISVHLLLYKCHSRSVSTSLSHPSPLSKGFPHLSEQVPSHDNIKILPMLIFHFSSTCTFVTFSLYIKTILPMLIFHFSSTCTLVTFSIQLALVNSHKTFIYYKTRTRTKTVSGV